jgi:hypothetical protein
MCVDGLGSVDYALWRLIPYPTGPAGWPEFYSWARNVFQLQDDSWGGAGAGDPGRGDLPYGKMITSIYLLAYGLRDEYIPQWHANDDYLNAAWAISSNYHGPFYCNFRNASDKEASAHTGVFAARDYTDFKCPIFDFGKTTDDPAERASVMVHESWHHWQEKYDYSLDHQTGGAITAPDGDWYYFHGTGYFEFGTLWVHDTGVSPIRFHSPYQVQTEYHADLAEYPVADLIPVAVTASARAFGNRRLATQCKNAISYRIGQPRPW